MHHTVWGSLNCADAFSAVFARCCSHKYHQGVMEMRAKWALLLAWLLGLLMLLTGGCAAKQTAQAEELESRVKLLEQAMAHVGVCSPEDAVDVWVQGLMERSAAMQYAVMSPALKAQYAKALEKTAPNWVTGVSSPWVNGYSVFDVSEISPDMRLFSLSITTQTSAGAADSYLAVLALEPDGAFWRIGGICTDEELLIYTGFNE